MKNRKKLLFFTAIIELAANLLSATLPSAAFSAALSAPWPQRNVKLVVPLGPASGADVTARLLGEHLSRRWGQAVVVENRPGADGIIGITAFLGGSDDHALLLAPTSTFTATPLLRPGRAAIFGHLAPIARVTNTFIAITVPASLQVSSLAELMMRVGAHPGRYHWASMTGATDLVFSGFLKSAGLEMVRVPYRESVPATTDLSEGRLDVLLSALTTVLPQVAAGRIRVMALTNHLRAPVVSEVPTVAEAGYPALQYDGLAGLFAAATMPVERRERIADDVRAALADPDVAARIAATGQIVSPGTASEFTHSIAEQSASFIAIARSLGLQP